MTLDLLSSLLLLKHVDKKTKYNIGCTHEQGISYVNGSEPNPGKLIFPFPNDVKNIMDILACDPGITESMASNLFFFLFCFD